MASELPFQVEYAKSGRSSCKKCKENIGQDTLRVAIMIQSPFFDGKMATWHHLQCFFEKKTTLKNVDEIANFSNLRWEDQEKIKNHIGSKNGSKSSEENSEFSVEYAKSARSTCRGCGEKILKGVVRISKLDVYNSERKKYGPSPMWHHIDCFVNAKEELQYNDSAEKLPGFNTLKDEDKNELREKIGTQGVKRKAEEDSGSKSKKSVRKEDSKLKTQNEALFKMRDNLSNHLKKKDMINLLELNNQHVSTGLARLVDHLSDCMVFGALKECPDCHNARPRFLNNAYVCPGHLTEWTKCQYETRYPEREKFVVPDEFKEEFEFLKKYKCIVQERYLPEASTASNKNKTLPLDNFKIVLLGKLDNQANLTKQLQELGATVVKTIDSTVKLIISTKEEVEKKTPKIMKAYRNDIHVVSVDFLESVRKGSPAAFSIKEHTISTWGGDPVLKFGIKQENKKRKQEEESNAALYMKSAPQKMKISVKGAAAVDPESELESTCHVYQKKDNIYNAVLAYVDMSKGTNSFYKMQLLEHNKQSKYFLFRQWGRVGTDIGGKKIDKFAGVEAAITEFERLYFEKTCNKWWDRKNFVKKPGGMYPLDIDYGQEDSVQVELKPGDNSKLSKPVQELICLIFDIEAMKKAMVEFEIDLKKMPLGKLSKKQIEMAYKVLCEAQQILVTGSNSAKITDVTNRFFTLIPHDFGMKKPPLLDSEEIIKSKIEMVDSLMEIEFAYNLIKSEHNDAKDPIDEHYEKLNTDIEVLSKDSEDYERIHTYLKNTHAKTHSHYTLRLDEVFKINRHGENERYQKYKDLHNKKLLWHGSRLTNYVGILSQGLRIAPPEAPVSGYMFGKGIYFADMVSKSANYCCTTRNNSTALMLLCEVALGNMYEKTHSEYIEKLPKGKNSTFGMGQTIPDPKTKAVVGDVEIPYGQPVVSDARSVLLYNEYIVYDVNQVNLKYLLKVNFKYK
ncbi:hypothetical protein JTE90_001045 [Oedothorax gibbosus]|uniref:Poly [ADP-ribose] polymerase n=1 Tax=Oedothorax gibbosus TaxID=931172 RepID=A0AAV6UII0_9ARAC|nr:hypothetical protein JTE90_001045 [Oedothorax gibbosus]